MSLQVSPIPERNRSAARTIGRPATWPQLRGSAYPGLVGKALLLAARAQTARWDRALARLEEEQTKALRAIVDRSASTEFGRAHGFSGIRDHAAFARAVPVGDYDSHSPYIERMRKGERGLLVPELIEYFGNSSGSSVQGKPKFLPISETQIGHTRGSGSDALFRQLLARGDDSFPSGFTLGLFPPITMKREGPVWITSNPALMVTRLPAPAKPMYLPHADILQIGDYETKLAAIADRYLDWDVRAVSGTTCWFTLLFEKVLASARRREPGIRCVAEVWPNLRYLIGGGVSADPYLPIIKRLVGHDQIKLVDTYNATEGGIYAASDETSERGMLVLPHRGTFFEFVPLDTRESANPTRVPLWGVEKDRPYSVVVTTVSGLYAYEIGDIVRFTETSRPRVEFMGRLSGCLSTTQELTTHVEIERAVAYAIGQVPCRTIDFGAAADVGVDGGPKSRYLLFVEFDEGAEPAELESFARAFDEGLKKENRVYREHRNGDVAILPPRVFPLVSGGAKRFLDQTTRGNVQGKFPRILDEARKSKLISFVRRPSDSTPMAQ
jgi:hypothetical protein